jgi:hypothetical protein
MNKKIEEIKTIIFNELREEDQSKSSFSYEELDKLIFRNRLTMRLKKEGYAALQKIFWSEKFDVSGKPLTGRELLTLKNHVPLPYFLTNRYLYLFSTKQSFILSLHGGNVKQWLAKIYRKSQENQ